MFLKGAATHGERDIFLNNVLYTSGVNMHIKIGELWWKMFHRIAQEELTLGNKPSFNYIHVFYTSLPHSQPLFKQAALSNLLSHFSSAAQ